MDNTAALDITSLTDLQRRLSVGKQPMVLSEIYQEDVNIAVWQNTLLKGDGWHNNEQAGLVHRSPALASNEKRLVLTLDFSN